MRKRTALLLALLFAACGSLPGWRWIVGPIDGEHLTPARPPCGERRA